MPRTYFSRPVARQGIMPQARCNMAKRSASRRNRPQGLCLDKGYDFDEVREIVKEFGFTAYIRARGEEALAIKQEDGFKARRWVVERTHSWMNRFRRILVRWEKLSETFIAMMPAKVLLTSFMSCRLAPSMATAIEIPAASVSRLRLTPCLPRSVGFAPVFLSPPPAPWSWRHPSTAKPSRCP